MATMHWVVTDQSGSERISGDWQEVDPLDQRGSLYLGQSVAQKWRKIGGLRECPCLVSDRKLWRG